MKTLVKTSVIEKGQEKLRFIHSLPKTLKSLLVSSFVVAFGSFMVTPFLAVFLKQSVGLPLPQVGLLVALSTLVQFGGGALGGVVAERLGLKPAMVFALSYRVVGFLLLAAAPAFPIVTLPAVLLIAAGSALYLPANRAYVVLSVAPEAKPLFLSLSNAALNAGMALGPLCAALVIDQEPSSLLVGVAVLFVVMVLVHQTLLQPLATPNANVGLSELPKAIRRAGRPVFFSTYTFYIFFFFQSFLSLYAASESNLRAFSWGMALNFVMMFVLQPWLSQKIATVNYRMLLVGAFSVMGMGMATIGMGGTGAMLLGIAIMTLGQLSLFLRADLEVLGRLPQSPAMAFGIQRLAAGVGGMASGLIGGWVFEYCKSTGSLGHFWLFVGAQCLVGVALSFCFAEEKVAGQTTVQPC